MNSLNRDCMSLIVDEMDTYYKFCMKRTNLYNSQIIKINKKKNRPFLILRREFKKIIDSEVIPKNSRGLGEAIAFRK